MRCEFLVIGTPNLRDPTSDKREIQICIHLILEGSVDCWLDLILTYYYPHEDGQKEDKAASGRALTS